MPDRSDKQQRVEQQVRCRASLRAQGYRYEPLSTRMAADRVPGVSLAVMDAGEIAWAAGYGVLEAGKPEPVEADTLFQAASISKPVSALVVLSLVQEGRLGLDEDIRAYQTRWRLPWQGRVTLRQLLSHSAGVSVSGFDGYACTDPVPTLLQVLNGEPPANSPAIFVDTLPAINFRYSGGGYEVAQQLVEDVTGRPFWQVARERVLEPAGMSRSTFECPLPVDWQPGAARGHRQDGQPIAGGWHLYPESTAAGLWTTAPDLARLLVLFEQTLSGESQALVSRALLEEMLTPQIRLQGVGLDGWEGLGLFLTGDGENVYYGHGGSNEGYRCQMIVRKGRGQAAVVMTNSDTGSGLRDQLMSTIAEVYGWRGFSSAPARAVRLPAENLARFTGRYHLENGLELRVRVKGARLVLVLENQPELAMKAVSKNQFLLSRLNTAVQFILEGEVCTGLVLSQDEIDITGSRQPDPAE